MVQPPVTGEAAVDTIAAFAIAVFVEKLQPGIPDNSASARYRNLLPNDRPKCLIRASIKAIHLCHKSIKVRYPALLLLPHLLVFLP